MPDYILRRRNDGDVAGMAAAIEAVPALRIVDKTDVMILVRGERTAIDALPDIGGWNVFEQKRIPLPDARPKPRPPEP